jgi:hypothetical protein
MNSIVSTVISLILTVAVSIGIGVGYYQLGLQGWIKAWRLPSYRRLLAGIFGVIVFLAGLSFSFINAVTKFVGGLGFGLVGLAGSVIMIIVAGFWALIALIAWLVILAISKNSIDH